MAERKFAVSSDSSSLLGNPKYWEEVWRPAIQHERFAGFEMLGWLWAGKFLVEPAKDLNLKIIGIHGRTGGIHDQYALLDRAVLGGLNYLLLPTPKLVEHFKNLKYILIHGPELRIKENRLAITENAKSINTLYIENHLRPGALGSALEAARELRADGVNAGVMFDLFHFARAYDHRKNGNGLGDIWPRILSNLDMLYTQKDDEGKKIPVSIHLPLGTNKGDSLNFEEITPQMWRDLAEALKARPETLVVIENQQAFPANIVMIASWRDSQRKRNTKMLETLDKHGVI